MSITTDKIMDMLCNEIDEIAKQDKISMGDLDALQKLILTKEKLLRIEEIEDNLGYSQSDGYSRNNYRYGNSYANRGKHLVRAHYSNGRDARNRYSMAEGNEMLAQTMQDMMIDPMTTEADKNILRRALEVVNR